MTGTRPNRFVARPWRMGRCRCAQDRFIREYLQPPTRLRDETIWNLGAHLGSIRCCGRDLPAPRRPLLSAPRRPGEDARPDVLATGNDPKGQVEERPAVVSVPAWAERNRKFEIALNEKIDYAAGSSRVRRPGARPSAKSWKHPVSIGARRCYREGRGRAEDFRWASAIMATGLLNYQPAGRAGNRLEAQEIVLPAARCRPRNDGQIPAPG